MRTVEDLERLRRVMGIIFGVEAKKTRSLRCGTGRVGVDIGDTLFALEVDEVGTSMGERLGNALHLKYDVGTSMVCVIMQFTHACVSTIADLVAQRIITNIKHSMVQLFASRIVVLDTNFTYTRYIYTTASIFGDIVAYILDEGGVVNTIHIPISECNDLITAYNNV